MNLNNISRYHAGSLQEHQGVQASLLQDQAQPLSLLLTDTVHRKAVKSTLAFLPQDLSSWSPDLVTAFSEQALPRALGLGTKNRPSDLSGDFAF